jgi:hypothetical protein
MNTAHENGISADVIAARVAERLAVFYDSE